MQQCSAKYQAAKSAGSLGGMNWNAFRKAECDASASVAPATTGVAPSPAPAKAVSAPPPVRSGNAVFPNAIAPKFANDSAGKARMQTCLEQYRANETTGGNGDLKWIQKGGGYYSECNKRLSAR